MTKIGEESDRINAAILDAPEREPERQRYFIELLKDIFQKRAEATGRVQTFCCVTFGCQMNERDSEKLRGVLEEAGLRKTDSEDADLVLYNTCTVRENANVRVYGRLGAIKSKKSGRPDMLVGLCGCMMQEENAAAEIMRRFDFVDLIFGTYNIYKLAELICKRLAYERPVVDILEKSGEIVENLPADRTYSFKSGVNIMYGCDNFCSYCIVPYVRGRERSRSLEDILTEIRGLADDGVKEIMLLGQNVNSYGKTLEPRASFAALLRSAAGIDGIERIRFMTSHPKDLSDELIDVMAKEEKVCPHLHLPLQSGSSRILKAMNRRYDKEGYLSLVDRIRAKMPDISLTTDIIVGFPQETEEDFSETMDVVDAVGFDSAFTFIYSKRSGTPAATMPGQIPEDVAKDRFNRLLELVQKRARQRCSRFEGRVMGVLVECVNERDGTLLTGRLANNLTVHFAGDKSLIGEIVDVRLTKCMGFYYMAEQA